MTNPHTRPPIASGLPGARPPTCAGIGARPLPGSASHAAVSEFVIGLLVSGELAALEPQQLRDDTDLLTDGVLDSFGLLELIGAVEENFDIELDFGEADEDNLTRLGTFCAYAVGQVERRAA